MPYSRAHPSLRYLQLLELNLQLHKEGFQAGLSPQETFSGSSLLPQIKEIYRLIEATKARSLLDYGCGKAMLYHSSEIRLGERRFPSIKAYWGIDAITLYDPAYPPYIQLPQGKFDGVICTDVLEHCPEEDLPWIIEELFSYANKFVFASIAVYPAIKILPNGENAHVTVRPQAWWQSLVNPIAERYPTILYKLVFKYNAHS